MSAINTNPANIELRYLRLTIQTNVPTFLGYCNKISSDKLFLFKEIERLKDKRLKTLIVAFLVQSDNNTTTKK